MVAQLRCSVALVRPNDEPDRAGWTAAAIKMQVHPELWACNLSILPPVETSSSLIFFASWSACSTCTKRKIDRSTIHNRTGGP